MTGNNRNAALAHWQRQRGDPLRVGFTGTRKSLTEAQEASLFSTLLRLRTQGLEVMDNGCCDGADRVAHEIWGSLGGRFHLRPGDMEQHAWAASVLREEDEIELPIGYMERNDYIARAGTVVAAPAEDVEAVRSGTWATVRRARRSGSTVLLVLPCGRVDTTFPQGDLPLFSDEGRASSGQQEEESRQ